jgi:hypothetical protein
MRLAIAAVAAAVSVAVLPARAADPSTQAPPKAAQNLARLLLTDAEWSGLLDRYAQRLSGQLTETLATSGEAVPDDLTGTIRKQLGEQLPYADTTLRHAQALAARFSSDELKKAHDFYSSKAGSKVLHGLPETQAELGEYLQGRLAAVVPAIVKQIAPKALEGSPPPGDQHEPGAKPSPPPQARKPPEPGAAESGSGAAKP